ncbi:MAG TPA: hypothetical protein VJ890_24960 [Vineibacter sp.]|nr:hypothetical protein [Vineibacter sp.]
MTESASDVSSLIRKLEATPTAEVVKKFEALNTANCTANCYNDSSSGIIIEWAVKFIFKDGKNDNQGRKITLNPGQSDSLSTTMKGCVVGLWGLIRYIDGNGDEQLGEVLSDPAPPGKCYSKWGIGIVDQTMMNEADIATGRNRIKVAVLAR